MATYPDFIRTQLHGRKMLRATEERRLLRAGVEVYGLDMPTAQRQLSTEATRASIVRQMEVDSATRAFLTARPRRSGRAARVSSAEFARIGDYYRARAGGQLPQAEVNSRVKRLMIEEGLEPRAEGWLWRTQGWFTSIPDQAPEPTPTGGSTATGTGGAGSGADGTAIVPAVPARAILRAWIERANALDLNGLIALYHPQALLLATAAPDPRHGPDPIRQYFQGLMAHPRFAVRLGPELAASGQDPVTLSGLYEFSWMDSQGQPLVIPSRYTFVITRPQAGGSQEASSQGGAGAGSAPGTIEGGGAILQHHSSSLPNMPGAGQV